MRIVAIILSLCCLATANNLVGLDFCPENPAEIAEYYYPSIGLSLGTVSTRELWHKNNTTDYFGDFFLYQPSRTKPVVFHQFGFDLDSNRVYYNQLRAKRKSYLLNIGLGTGLGVNYDKMMLDIALTPGLYIKPNDHYRLGLLSQGLLRTDASKHFSGKNTLTTKLLLRVSKEQSCSFTISSTPRVGLKYLLDYKNIGFSAGIESTDLSKNKCKLRGNLSISYNISSTARLRASYNRHEKRINRLSYVDIWGEYTPPIAFSPAFAPIANNRFTRYGLGIKPLITKYPPPI